MNLRMKRNLILGPGLFVSELIAFFLSSNLIGIDREVGLMFAAIYFILLAFHHHYNFVPVLIWQEIVQLLRAHILYWVKCRVLENSLLTAREACQELCVLTRSEPVQVIGTKFVLYRTSHTIPREKRIELVTAGQKKTIKVVKSEKAATKAAKSAAKTGKPAAKSAVKSAARKPVARKSGKK